MSDTPTPQQQEIFQLSWWSSISATVQPQPGQSLEQATYVALQALLSNPPAGSPITTPWNLVWGPYVLEGQSTHLALNTMYAAQSTADPTQYVIAIAGTNARSIFDWVVEDGLVGVQIPWLYALLTAPDAKISLGTGVGLAILQNGTPGPGIPGEGTTILDFVGTLPKDGSTQLTVTGHSLGGALAPTVALWLHDVRPLWDAFGTVSLSTLPTAGPTPGNGAYAEYLDEKLPTARFHNEKDVVPHAWAESDLVQIPLLYAPDIVSPTVFLAVAGAMALASGGDYTQLSADTPAFPETVQKDLIDKDQTAFVNFLTQVGWQHITAYADYFGLNDEPSRRIDAVLSSRASLSSSGVLQAGGELVAHAATVPVSGVPTPVPGRNDPAIRALVDQVVSELKKKATPEQQAVTFPVDAIRIAAPSAAG